MYDYTISQICLIILYGQIINILLRVIIYTLYDSGRKPIIDLIRIEHWGNGKSLRLIELDGRGHASRRTKDAIRDKLLNERGFNVVRVNQDSVWDRRRNISVLRIGKLLSVIEKYVTDINLSSLDPSFAFGKYRVVVREANTATEIIY